MSILLFSTCFYFSIYITYSKLETYWIQLNLIMISFNFAHTLVEVDVDNSDNDTIRRVLVII